MLLEDMLFYLFYEFKLSFCLIDFIISLFGRKYNNERFYMDSSEGFHSKCKSAANLLQKRRQLHRLLGPGMYGADAKTKDSNSFMFVFEQALNGY
jgi:hypothetical protein